MSKICYFEQEQRENNRKSEVRLSIVKCKMKNKIKDILEWGFWIVFVAWIIIHYFVLKNKFYMTDLNLLFARIAFAFIFAIFFIIKEFFGWYLDPLRKCPHCKQKLKNFTLDVSKKEVLCKKCTKKFNYN